MKCKHCGKDIPTRRQIEAYRLVYLHNMKHSAAAAVMKITRQGVEFHLRILRENHPELFKEASNFKITTYCDAMNNKIKR